MSLKELLYKEKSKLFLYGLGVFLASITNIIFTYGMSYSFKVLDVSSLNEVWPILAISILIMLLPALLQLLSRLLRIRFMTDVLREIRLLAYRKIMRLNIEDFSKEEKEVYQSSLISDINLFEKDFFLAVLNIGYTVFSFSISFLILMRYSWVIGMIAVVTSIAQYVIAKFYENKVRDAQSKTQEQNKKFNTVLANMVSGFRTIKSYASEKLFSYRFGNELESLESIKAQYFRYNKEQEVISHAVSTASSVAIFFISALLMSQNRMHVSDFIMVLNLSGAMIWGMISAISFFNRLKASVDIYNRIVDTEIIDDHKASKPIRHVLISVDHLSVSYGEKEVIKDLSFTLGQNEKLLIHGPSGTGKTTLLNCLAKNLESYEGSIKYDGVALKDIHHDDFLDISAYVRQSHFMFDESIKNNIVMNMEYDEEKFRRVIQQAALEEWLLEVGSDHELIKNGSNISGGQRQRISFARELYSDYDVIFIDEPSASLDDENAKIIYQTIFSLDKTVICVTHRHLEILKPYFDKVISFKEDRI